MLERLSSLIAEIFMGSFEEKIFNPKYSIGKNVEYWYRYADDVLCLWKGTEAELTNFLAFINSLHPTIQLTVEVGGYRINFLDLTINISNFRDEFQKVYRKPTYTDALIDSTSFHPPPCS